MQPLKEPQHQTESQKKARKRKGERDMEIKLPGVRQKIAAYCERNPLIDANGVEDLVKRAARKAALEVINNIGALVTEGLKSVQG